MTARQRLPNRRASVSFNFEHRGLHAAHVDPRLAFLARAAARLVLVEAGEMNLDEATNDLILPACDCQRWPLAAQWERTHPPRRNYRGRR